MLLPCVCLQILVPTFISALLELQSSNRKKSLSFLLYCFVSDHFVILFHFGGDFLYHCSLLCQYASLQIKRTCTLALHGKAASHESSSFFLYMQGVERFIISIGNSLLNIGRSIIVLL